MPLQIVCATDPAGDCLTHIAHDLMQYQSPADIDPMHEMLVHVEADIRSDIRGLPASNFV